jgi:hypothetical protein
MFNQNCCPSFGGNFNLQMFSDFNEQFAEVNTTINSNPDKIMVKKKGCNYQIFDA